MDPVTFARHSQVVADRSSQKAKLFSLLEILDEAVAVQEPPFSQDEEDVVVEEFGAAGAFSVGDVVFAIFYVDGLWYRASVEEVLEGGMKYLVLFTEYGNHQETRASGCFLFLYLFL
jgi:hypothetical protein